MDIERLKELQQEVGDIIFNALSKLTDKDTMEITLRFGEDLQTLIDEAIARQSVKSEDVADAIEQMEDAISPRYLESDGEWTGYNEFSTSAIRTAITALQAYQPEPPKGE